MASAAILHRVAAVGKWHDCCFPSGDGSSAAARVDPLGAAPRACPLTVLAANRLSFGLNARIDVARLADTYRRERRVQVPDFLEAETAARFAEAIRRRDDWVQVVNSGDRVFELDRPTRAGLAPEQAERLDDAVFAGAREGFQFRYETIRLPDDADARRRADDMAADFALFMSSDPTRALLRAITGHDDIDFADAQATAYGPGDFLTAHDDAVAGKQRRAAYVFGLTDQWRIEWGGLLLFHGHDGNVEHGLLPRFNTLNLFAVPQLHSVSMVTRAAPYRRYSVTGWLRGR